MGHLPLFFSQLRRPDMRVCSSDVLACSASFLSSWGDPAHTSRTSAAHLVASSCMRFASCLALPSALCFALLCKCLSVSRSKPACCFPVLLPPFKASRHAVTATNAFLWCFLATCVLILLIQDSRKKKMGQGTWQVRLWDPPHLREFHQCAGPLGRAGAWHHST